MKMIKNVSYFIHIFEVDYQGLISGSCKVCQSNDHEILRVYLYGNTV